MVDEEVVLEPARPVESDVAEPLAQRDHPALQLVAASGSDSQ